MENLIKRENKLDAREAGVILIFMLASKFSDMTPTILLNDAWNAAWIMPIISSVLIFIPFMVLLSLLSRFNNLGLIDLIQKILGKYVGFAISLVLFIVALTITAVQSRNYADITKSMFFIRTPIFALFLLGWIGSYYLANRGLQTIGRTAWIFFFIMNFLLAILVIAIWKETIAADIFPIAGPGISKVFKSSLTRSSLFADLLYLTVLYKYVRTPKEFKKGSVIGYWFAVAQMTLFIYIYITVFDYPAVVNIAFPFHEVTMLARFGRFFTNTESLYLGFWVIAGVIKFAAYIYITTIVFADTIKLKEFEPLILPITTLVIILGMLPKNPYESTFIFRSSFVDNLIWPVLIGLPFILWIVAKFRKDLREDENKD